MSDQLNSLKHEFDQHVLKLQEAITQQMQQRDGGLTVEEENWERTDHAGDPGGGGKTRAFTGELFEKAGVNTSCVHGEIDPEFAKKLEASSNWLWASGISLIIHPKNPKIPTVHANFRMIHAGDRFWFGGGADLTPYYPYEEDFQFFHDSWAKACAPYQCYEWMKKACDEYFVNDHREQEMRGVGGIFFDHYNSGDPQADVAMVKALADSFIPSYFPLVDRRRNESWGQADEDFQLHRRGRYVEFNLLHDRGTLFGLKTKGRTESILISLPPRCRFSYAYAPPSGSPHEKMMAYYFPRDWA